MIFTILGIFSALLVIAATVPYLIDTIKNNTRPHRVTWGIILSINIVGYTNQLASGAKDSLWFLAAATLMTSLVFLASLWHGVEA